jgi:thioredoxin reductase (NADPH)
MKAENVEFVWDSAVTEILSDGRVTGVKVKNLKDGSEHQLDFSGLFVSIGRSPATDFLKGSIELDAYGYIVADESTRTSVPGVFAVGDVRTKALRQVVTAVADGATAIHYAEEYLNET